MSGQRILVTGASGLLGTALLEELAGAHELHALVRRMPDAPVASVRYHLADFRQGWDDAPLPARIDTIFHLAQSPHIRDAGKRHELYAVNVGSAVRLLAYTERAGASRFVFASSGGIYAPSDSPLTETSPIAIGDDPLAEYFKTKRECERLIETHDGSFHRIILRPFFIYGAQQVEAMLIPRLIAQVRAGKPITLAGTDGVRLNPIYVSDAAAALAATLALENSEVINIGGPEVLAMRAIGEHIGAALGRAPQFTVTQDTPQTLVADIERMRKLLVSPRITFAEGIAAMIGTVGKALRHANV